LTHFWFSLRRLAHVAGVAAAHLAAHAASLLLARRPRLVRRLGVRALAGPQRLRVMLEEMGGAFIKFGQMLALQPDVLSLEYCDALFDLLDRVEPFGYEEVERTFVEETGQTPSELFDSFERRPLATASIGQVHRARTRDGRDVAVKIQRPEAEAEFGGDIRVMAAATGLVRRLRLKPLYWLLEPTEEFIAWTREELDYRSEARYVEQLRRNARANPRERVPAVFWQCTTRRTLVVEFLDGVTVLEYLRAVARGDELLPRRLRDAGFDPAAFARNVIDNFVSDAFRHGMFHADLHPANLLILPGNVVGYVDFGITAVLSRYSRQNLIALTHALVRADFEGMCAPFFNVSVTEADSDPEAFRAGLRRLGASWYETRDGRRQLRTGVTRVMLDMLRLSRRTGVWPERDVVKYIRSAVAADGLITRFAPGFDLGLHLEAVCREHLARQGGASLLSYGAFVNWAAAGGHIIEDGAFRASRFLQRVAAVGPGSGRDVGRREGDGGLRRRAVLLAAALFATSLLLAADGESARVGVNLFTAASLFIVSVTLTLWQTLRRLT
jgi:predicted unusual protein kinase regulating ubiquinone biosynthesis (AarF/ABC1/UbiB family)